MTSWMRVMSLAERASSFGLNVSGNQRRRRSLAVQCGCKVEGKGLRLRGYVCLHHLVEFFSLLFKDSVRKSMFSIPVCGTDFGGCKNCDAGRLTGGFALVRM